MKKLLLLLFCSLFTGGAIAQQLLDGYDIPITDTLFHRLVNDPGDTLDYSIVNSPVYSGAGALRTYFKTSGAYDYGNCVTLTVWNPDSTATWDFSDYDSLTFRYYVQSPIPSDLDMILRFCLLDASNSPNGDKTYDQRECEKYFAFLDILKEPATPGWHYCSIPLTANGDMTGKGFAQKTWGGMSQGNSTLDLDKIKGYVMEFMFNTQAPTTIVRGSMIFDQLELHGAKNKAVVFFNGKSIPSKISFSQGRSGSCVVSNEQTSNPATHQYSLKWTTPGQWDGPVFQFKNPFSLGSHWQTDTLKLKVKAPAGVGDLRLIFQDSDTDSTLKADYPFEASYVVKADDMNYDNSWKTLAIPLKNFDKNAGVWDDASESQVDGVFDSTKIWKFKVFRTNDKRWSNQVVYLDELWTGIPVFDVMPPAAALGVTGAAGNYSNLVIWQDVPGETSEVYDIYASTNPITDITSKDVDHIGISVAENMQQFDHKLMAPGKDQELSYYYAVICTDAAGNAGPVAATENALKNTAKAMPVISAVAPAGFAADGELGEWSAVTPTVVSLKNATSHVPEGNGYLLTDDNDLSWSSYLAVDNSSLYVALDVNDDALFEDPANDIVNSYMYDGIDIFLGLYDQRGEVHTAYKKGAETDYHFRLNKYGVILDQSGGLVVLDTTSKDFKFTEKFPSGYIIEAKIPFAKIAELLATGYVFEPKIGMRIPFDMIGNDNDDGSTTREAVTTYSAISNDFSYKSPNVWTNTWIGDQMSVGVEDKNNSKPLEYSLAQNYPNPFNPSTKIVYTIKAPGLVTLKVYNILGQEVRSLVNEYKNAGTFNTVFDGNGLASGMYVYQLKSGSYSSTKKMMMLK